MFIKSCDLTSQRFSRCRPHKPTITCLLIPFSIIRKALLEQELCVFTEEYAAELCKTENFQNLLKNSRIYAKIKLPETFSVI